MDWDILGLAFVWGIVSAVSLPLGAALGLRFKPSRKMIASLMSFGAGALLFALTIELFGVSIEHSREHGQSVVLVTALAAIFGGVIFHCANKFLNDRGAFIRNFSNTKKWLVTLKMKMSRNILEDLADNRVIHELPPEDVAHLLPYLRKHKFKKDHVIFNEGDHGESLYLIVSGRVAVIKSNGSGDKGVAELGANDVFGEMALVTDLPRVATVKTLEPTEVFSLSKKDLHMVAESSPALTEALSNITSERIDVLNQKKLVADVEAKEWESRALKALRNTGVSLTPSEIEAERSEAASKSNAGQAIWLGLLIDGLPESLVIGLLTRQPAGMSLAFIVGVFLANLPEALSGAASMENSGMKKGKIMNMWFSLCLMTGIGAFIGAVLFPANPHGGTLLVVAGIEGLAAGAMLTAIAESFLPEAFEQGGDIIGLTTLGGFICALMLKLV